MAGLAKAPANGRLEEKLLRRSKPRLLIVDELGHLPLGPAAAHLFFQLVSRRHERASMLITSNRPAVSGGKEFGDAVATTAILDRLLHHSQMITIRGDSYRLRDKRRSGLLQKAAVPPDQVGELINPGGHSIAASPGAQSGVRSGGHGEAASPALGAQLLLPAIGRWDAFCRG